LFIITSDINWVVCGTGTPKDRDEVNEREVCECDLEAIGIPLMFNVIHSAADLARMLPTLDLTCEENTDSAVVKLATVMFSKMNS
jgi:hypothetical protein